MGYYLGDMIHEYLEHNNTEDIYRYCMRGLAQSLAREKLIDKWGEENVERTMGLDEDEDGVNGLEIIYEVEEPLIDNYELQIKRFINNLRGEIYD